MRCTISTSSNPYFNLATEDYFLRNSTEEHFLIYINEPCIVVGKHQNLLAEINLPFALENKIKLARRISGGGTVYQDYNNLNFSFIHNCTNLEKVNFTKFTTPVLEALKNMGLDVEFSGRNDLLIDTKKISGNAMHILKSRVLSHGTLLFKTDLNQLSAALRNNPLKYIDKSIKSVRSKVANISDFLEYPQSIDMFAHHLFEEIASKSADSFIHNLNDQEVESIRQISEEKYETWEWIYGYSPRYLFRNSYQLPNLTVEFELQVERGIIISQHSDIDPATYPVYHTALEILVNVKHDYQIIYEIFASNKLINSCSTFNIDDFCDHLF